MRKACILIAVVMAAACGDQTSADPCVLEVDMTGGAATLQLNATTTVRTSVEVKSGACMSADKSIEWGTSNSEIADFIITTDSLAVVRARRAGTAIIRAHLIRTPTIRDSTQIVVVNPTDN